MGKTWLIPFGLAAAFCMATGLRSVHAAALSRFASYDSEAQCVTAHTIAPATCHSAFANARAEYEAKTPAFANQALCRQHYASCMAWPPGGAPAKAAFRPAWDGVDIVDTPTERSVTPSPGSTGRAIRFAARPLTEEPRPLVIRGAGAPRPSPVRTGAPFLRRAGNGPEKSPLPGSGFKMEDGVLTYPAPERFQPKNLPKEN